MAEGGGGQLIALHRWVEHEMHGLLGMAAAPIVAMVLDLASQCSSGKDLERELAKTAFPKGEGLSRFCGELVEKLRPPRASKRGPAASSSEDPGGKRAKAELGSAAKAERVPDLGLADRACLDTAHRRQLMP